ETRERPARIGRFELCEQVRVVAVGLAKNRGEVVRDDGACISDREFRRARREPRVELKSDEVVTAGDRLRLQRTGTGRDRCRCNGDLLLVQPNGVERLLDVEANHDRSAECVHGGVEGEIHPVADRDDVLHFRKTQPGWRSRSAAARESPRARNGRNETPCFHADHGPPFNEPYTPKSGTLTPSAWPGSGPST